MEILRLGHKKTGGPGRVQFAEAAPGPTRSLLMSESQKVKENLSKNDIFFDSNPMLPIKRLSRYINFCNGDYEKAVRLYRWNTAVGASFYGPLQALEITLREKIISTLTAYYGDHWFDNPKLELDNWTVKKLNESRKRIHGKQTSTEKNAFLLNLSFGFWVKLLDAGSERDGMLPKSDYEKTLWRPALRKAFPFNDNLTRREVYILINSLRRLRNHIAHHEPIFQRGLKSDYQTILRILRWMSPVAEQWVVESSRVLEVLKQRHATHTIKF